MITLSRASRVLLAAALALAATGGISDADRVEARDALSKLQYLYSLSQLDRSELPWRGPGDAIDEDKSVVVEL